VNPFLTAERAWFAAMPASRLAVMRIMVGAYTLRYLGQRVRRLGQIWAINAFLMHWGIFLLMGIKFRYQ
jgi:hypothetical protein